MFTSVVESNVASSLSYSNLIRTGPKIRVNPLEYFSNNGDTWSQRCGHVPLLRMENTVVGILWFPYGCMDLLGRVTDRVPSTKEGNRWERKKIVPLP